MPGISYEKYDRTFITETRRVLYDLFVIKPSQISALGQNYEGIYKSVFSQDFAVSMITLVHSLVVSNNSLLGFFKTIYFLPLNVILRDNE